MSKQCVLYRWVLVAAAGLVLAWAGPGAAWAAGQGQDGGAEGVRCAVEWAPMRDGVRLATEVYLPAGDGPFPVILQRTPYNRRSPNPGSDCDSGTGRYFAERGYATLNQDTRGRYRSEGEFDAMRQEAADGYDAVEWAAAQPWSNGKVGMIGGSYVGLTQWQAAVEQPPHLVAIAPHYSSSDYHKGWTYQGGAFDLWFALSWTAQTLAPDTLQRRLEAGGMPRAQALEEVGAFVAEGQEKLLGDWLWQLPLADFAGFRRSGNIAAYYDEWLARPSYDDYWAHLDLETKWPLVEVPALITGGWYDIFQEGTIRNFMGVRAEGGTDVARNGTRLIMRALCHACPGDTTAGDIDFGPDNVLDLNAAWARWFDYWLKGVDNGVADDPAVRLFVMTPPDEGTAGGGFWITADEFPLPDAVETRFYLQSGGGANSAAGDGVLSDEGPAGPADEYVYDPNDPVPTVGGNMCCQNGLLASGAFDQREVERRDDVLVYTSEPLAEDLTVIGPGRGAPVGGVVGPRHRLHGQARRRAPRRLRPQRVRGHRPGAVPQLGLPRVVAHAGGRARLHHRPRLHRHRVPRRAPHPPGDQLVELPALRPEPEHRRSVRAERGSADGDPAGAARRPAPVAARAAGRTERAGAVADSAGLSPFSSRHLAIRGCTLRAASH